MDDHFIAHLDVGDIFAHLVDDAAAIAAAVAEAERRAGAGPRHRHPAAVAAEGRLGRAVDQHFVVGRLRHVKHFHLEGFSWLAEALLPNQPGDHLLRDMPDGRHLTDMVQIFQRFRTMTGT